MLTSTDPVINWVFAASYPGHFALSVLPEEAWNQIRNRRGRLGTENDQYKHLSNVSEMIVLIILGWTHQMSILNGLAHQLYTLMADVWFSSNTKLFCELQYGAKRRWKFKESRKKRDRSRVLAEAAEFLAACEQKRKKPKNRTASVFWKNPSTGLRTTHSKYRPRKGHRASSV